MQNTATPFAAREMEDAPQVPETTGAVSQQIARLHKLSEELGEVNEQLTRRLSMAIIHEDSPPCCGEENPRPAHQCQIANALESLGDLFESKITHLRHLKNQIDL